MNAPETAEPPIRLTRYSHGGGCGCKIAPAVLSEILASIPVAARPAELLVGIETSDDAAVYRLNDEQAIVATTDFFTPIVDDPADFGRIAATNAISDVYAMGGRPIFALAVVGMPLDKLPLETIRRVLSGGESVCAAAGIPIAGGHSIDTLEPIYGLSVTGLVRPDRIKRNSGAKPGDALILGKPLGIGILSAALRKWQLPPEAYQHLVGTATQLNTPGPRLAELEQVHALTDVTGFGLAGHILEICRGSGLGASVKFDGLPVLSTAFEYAQQGVATGASARNWAGYGAQVQMPIDFPLWKRNLLSDPQTSGGLLVACAPESAAAVLRIFHEEGFAEASRIGTMQPGGCVLSIG